MPNLINTDNAGNTFYNYITPVIQGETSSQIFDYAPFFQQAFGSGYFIHASVWGGVYDQMYFRLPAPGIETKTGTVNSNASTWRFNIRPFNQYHKISTGLSGNTASVNVTNNSQSYYPNYNVNDNKVFLILNDYSFIQVVFDLALSTLRSFVYTGYLREPVYTGSSTYPLGACIVMNGLTLRANRINIVGGTSATDAVVALSTAADAITSPPIVCTAGTDPGDGSETFTDVVIRDAAAPNNPVGKLWNCIDMPATCNVGELWRNTGAHDGDGSTSEQDVYLCVMPWGTRKLGMRVWTENVT